MKHLFLIETVFADSPENMIEVCEAVIAELRRFQIDRRAGVPLFRDRSAHAIGYVDLPDGKPCGWWSVYPHAEPGIRTPRGMIG